MCNVEIGYGKPYSADQVRKAVRNGLRPRGGAAALGAALGVDMYTGWVQFVMSDTTGWALCTSCAAELEGCLRGPHPARPESHTITRMFYGKTTEEAMAAALAAGISSEQAQNLKVTRDVKEETVEGEGPDADGAIKAVTARLPSGAGAFAVGAAEIIQEGEKGQMEIEAPTEAIADEQWKPKALTGAVVHKRECLIAPNAGFLGIGKKPGLWRFSWSTPFKARVSYKLPAQVTLTYARNEERVVREVQPTKAVETVRCSSCSTELKRLDVDIADSIPDLQQWFGNVCVRCRWIYCSNCLQLGGPTPCPVCGEPTEPAQRLHLREIGALGKPAPPPKPAAAPGPRKFKLTAIRPEFLHAEFVPVEEPAGASAAPFQEAIQWCNQKEFDKAEANFRQAVMKGLPPTCESYANCQLGILALRKGQIDRGVDYLLRCLGATEKTASAAWEAVVRLQVIYAEAGRLKEADALGKVAAAANTRGLELTGEAEEELRQLIRNPHQQVTAPVSEVSTVPKAAKKPEPPRDRARARWVGPYAEAEMIGVLKRLCAAYVSNDTAAIEELEPKATEIGRELDRRGGMQEMRRIFAKLGGIRGSRALEMHWNGIGDWMG